MTPVAPAGDLAVLPPGRAAVVAVGGDGTGPPPQVAARIRGIWPSAGKLSRVPRPWNPTHFITFTPAPGVMGGTETWVVMLSPTPDPAGVRRAHTKDEWLRSAPGAWTCSAAGRWSHDGLSTPHGVAGTVSVSESSGGYHKVRWIPSHRIAFYASTGEPRWWVVMTRPDPYRPGHWSALTHEEWFSQCPAEWSCDPNGRWWWRGLATPKDEPGQVIVEDISGAYPVQQPVLPPRGDDAIGR